MYIRSRMELLELPGDLWHLAFVYLVTQRKPPNFDVFSEVRLSIEPQRADMILLRRNDRERLDHQAQVLFRLWTWLRIYTVLEYKSPINYAFKPGDLQRLYLYGLLWDMNHRDELRTPDELTLVLAVASLTPTFFDEIARMRLAFVALGGGYARVDGMMYTCYVVIIDDVCEEERDEYLRMFSHHDTLSGEVLEWRKLWIREAKMSGRNIEDMPDFEEWWENLMERTMRAIPLEKRLAGLDPQQRLAGLDPQQRLAGLDPQQRLAGLDPQQRLAGLDPQHIILGLPLEALRALPSDYIRTLAPDVQEKIRRRLQEETH